MLWAGVLGASPGVSLRVVCDCDDDDHSCFVPAARRENCREAPLCHAATGSFPVKPAPSWQSRHRACQTWRARLRRQVNHSCHPPPGRAASTWREGDVGRMEGSSSSPAPSSPKICLSVSHLCLALVRSPMPPPIARGAHVRAHAQQRAKSRHHTRHDSMPSRVKLSACLAREGKREAWRIVAWSAPIAPP